jgi:DNA-binding phage protein
MLSLKLKKWDSAEQLRTEEDMALYLEACRLEAGHDSAFMERARGTVELAKAMHHIPHAEEKPITDLKPST